MKQMKIIGMVIVLTLAAQAGWKRVKSLEHYGPKSFTLKQDVAYMELRKFTSRTDPSGTSKSVETMLRIYRTPLSSFGSQAQRIFSHTPVKKRYAFKKGEYVGLGGTSSWYYNGMMIDYKGKTWRLENVRDVVDMIKPIDTPAEIALVMWLHSDAREKSEKYSLKYRKSGSGYIVREYHSTHDYSNWKYQCGEYTFEYRLSREGKLSHKKRMKSKKFKECGSE